MFSEAALINWQQPAARFCLPLQYCCVILIQFLNYETKCISLVDEGLQCNWPSPTC